MPILPERLRSGDTVALIAPGSPPADPREIDRAVDAIRQAGFRVKLGRHARKRRGYLAGADRDRADDMMRMFGDPSVRAIFCLRGGYGSARLLPLLDYRLIRRNPKIFLGYSDITSLHCALLVKANLLTFHGPMAVSDFIQRDFPFAARDALLRTLTQPDAPGSTRKGFAPHSVSILRRGAASGQLIGGNLSVLCTTIGTPYQPPFRGRMLFLEEVEEKPFRVDRMLTHLLNAGLLQQVAGVAIGLCSKCVDPMARAGHEYRQSVEDVFRDRLLPLGVPVVTGLPFGHTPMNATLPFGGQVLLDGRKGNLVITKAVVS
jgi:muramoyltetrapeptide carboxypeptidase